MKLIEKIKEAIKDIQNNNKKFESIYNQGIDLFKQQNYKQAINYFEKASKKDSPQPQVYYNLALSYQHINEFENAISNYTKFLTQEPQDYDGMYNLGLLYFQTNKKTKALELFEKCLKLKKEENLVSLLTTNYLEQNHLEKVLAIKDELLSKPETTPIAMSIAKVFEEKQGLSSDYTLLDYAIEIYKKNIKDFPKNESAAYNCANCYSKKGDWDNAITYCKKALEINPNALEINELMGLVSYCANDMENAVIYFEKSFELNKNLDYKSYSNLAYAYEKNGNLDKAIKTFSVLLKDFEDFPAREEIKNHLTQLLTMV